MLWIIKWILFTIFLEPAVPFALRSNKSDIFKNDSKMDNWTKFNNENSKEKPSELSGVNVYEKIQNIFILGSEDDIVIFNNNSWSSHDHSKISSQSTNNKSFNNDDFFKVKRDPEGKLNLVFNDLVFSQNFASSMESKNLDNRSQPKIALPSSSLSSTTREKTNNGAITFPDDYGKPKCLDKGKPFCTDVQNYPKQELDKILKHEYSNYDVFFGNDLPQPLNISQRMSPGEETLCNSEAKISYPKAAETMDNGWLYIVNHGNYTQGVRTEECVNAGNPCMFSKIFPNGYVATCEQHYIYRSLVAYGKNGTIVNDHFRLPSCCKCIIKQV